MASPMDKKEVEDCVVEPLPETEGFYLHHVAYRIKDPRVTARFYSQMFGMRLLTCFDLPGVKTTMYIMGYGEPFPKDKGFEPFVAARGGFLEFMHHWGSEDLTDYTYNSGNKVADRGFSHICVRVLDLDKTYQRLKENGVDFVFSPYEGSASGISYLRDPDGYWVELVGSQVALRPGQPDSRVLVESFVEMQPQPDASSQ